MRDEAERRIGHLYPKVGAWLEPRTGRCFGEEEVREWKRIADSRVENSAERQRATEAAQACGYDSISSLLSSISFRHLTVIAWLWARTVKCPNPACGAQMPLVRSFALSTKAGKQAWVEPVVERFNAKTQGGKDAKREMDILASSRPGDFALNPVVRFEIRTGVGKPREGTVNRRGATCLCCGAAVPFDHVRAEGKAGRMSSQLMAIVAEGPHGRIYLPPSTEHVQISESANPTWRPDVPLPHNPRDFKTPNYGMTTFADLFTPRQLVALTTFSDLVGEARERVLRDAIAAGMPDDGAPLEEGGVGATAYADAVATYLSFGLDKGANLWSSIASWMNDRGAFRETFARQAIPMVWDFAEANPFSDAGGNLAQFIERIADVLDFLQARDFGTARQLDAVAASSREMKMIVSTDPPYYDNIGYADLSDYFYVWLRRSLSNIYPNLFSTLLVPKSQELVATPYRFGGDREQARRFFERGLTDAFQNIRRNVHPDYPVTVYYAFKQAETEDDNEGADEGPRNLASTGWETMLEGLIRSDFQVTGTWPMHTESPGRAVARGTNALASSIVLVCRPRPDDAPLTTRRDFLNALKRELPAALRDLQRGNIAPVDLAQASIGPGMAIYSRYRRVLEADGSAMHVRTALSLINQALDAYLAEQEGEYDADTRWALAWFEQFGFEEGPFGDAETLSKAKNTSVGGMVEAGILTARGGKVRLLRREELPADWDPGADRRLTVWEVAQQLIRTMQERGEPAAAALLAKVGGLGDTARDLAYRLYTICERKGWSAEALPYNALVVAWSEVGRLAVEKTKETTVQGRLF